MSAPTALSILPFTIPGRSIVTIESERVLVKVRHRTRWYVCTRKHGEPVKRFWVSSRRDASAIAEHLREYFAEKEARERDPAYQWFCARWKQMTEAERDELKRIAKEVSDANRDQDRS